MENSREKTVSDEKEVQEKELTLDELGEVTGGAGLRKVKREQTYDISDDIKEKI